MKLDQVDLALILVALQTERANARDDEWMYRQITSLIERIGRALEATAERSEDGEEEAQQRSTQ